jgi:hypothetical protein
MITYTLLHPLHNVPAVATQLEPWADLGTKLQFADGHTCYLTHDEIKTAVKAAAEWDADLLAWFRQALRADEPVGMKDCWGCRQWRPDDGAECPICGAGDVAF